MEDDIEVYVKTCHICQVDKTKRKKEVDGMASIMVVVDRFSKYSVFIAAPNLCSFEIAPELFYKYMVKYFGVSADIVSDRDTRFMGRLWKALFYMMGTDLKFSTANDPQTDGQT
ncbi:hypothetical protein KY290_012884 [Solanum tuberosum]|uniref:Integrase catalytic domain-containing protein n=1 Tax=Solanum tuberosum TaxID=4113 RepID=A0ABQ7VK91_SOLTU|nr:hypothetical protein KY290_012884 [Solanum tuberosum]